ncbi:MAG: gp53-like domain-containing protein [Clostridium chrysemydis]|uniref:gp53-like domain-containing protein n=1 Tax=Clostridium chrysemydis TaxID=2665504 RepID=UPI003F3B8EFC
MPLEKPNLIKPKIGGDPDIWGNKLNENIDKQNSFNKQIVDDSSSKDQEIARLDRDKINKNDLDVFVKNVVDNYVEENTKPQLNQHVETVNKPELDNYTNTKKLELNNLTDTKKEELNVHEKLKEGEITQFVEEKKEELVQYVDTVSKVEINSHTEKKKQEINTFTEEQKVELDAHEKLKEGQLDAYEKTKEGQLDNHVETVNKVELKNYVDSKKSEIDNFTEEQKVELNEHEKLKEGEFDEYIAGKIGGIDSHVESKKDEINTFTEEQKVELDAYEKVKEGQLESFKDEKKVEITSHTDAEIERINATGVDGKQDKTDNALETKDKTVVGAINELLSEKENLITRSNAINSESTTDVATSKAVNDLRLEVNKKTINAGDGLATTIDVGGGQTISITPKNESILVDNDSIWVNIVNDFTTGGVNKVASAESIKVLKQLIDTLGGGGATKLLRASEALGEYDYIGNLPSGGISITVGARLFNPTLYLDGVRLEENRYSVEFETGLITLNEPYADYDVVWVVEDQMPYHITFCFPTMNLLLASEDIKSRIKLGNVIKILGESDEDDGGHYLVKCEDVSKLNAVDIGEGRFLNEIPNTRISSIKAQVDQNKSDILSNAPNKMNQLFSRHYFHEIYSIGDENSVYSHAYPNGYDLTSKSPWTQYVFRTKSNGDGFDQYILGNNSITINGRNIEGSISRNSNGWCKLSNGLIIQWVTFNGIVGSNIQDIWLPISFNTPVFKVSGNIVSVDGQVSFLQLSPEGNNKVVARHYNGSDANPRNIVYGGNFMLTAIGW